MSNESLLVIEDLHAGIEGQGDSSRCQFDSRTVARFTP